MMFLSDGSRLQEFANDFGSGAKNSRSQQSPAIFGFSRALHCKLWNWRFRGSPAREAGEHRLLSMPSEDHTGQCCCEVD